MDGSARIQVPRRIRLVGPPLVLLVAWTLLGAVRHAAFPFVVAALVALLFDPLAGALGRAYVTEVDGRTSARGLGPSEAEEPTAVVRP